VKGGMEKGVRKKPISVGIPDQGGSSGGGVAQEKKKKPTIPESPNHTK